MDFIDYKKIDKVYGIYIIFSVLCSAVVYSTEFDDTISISTTSTNSFSFHTALHEPIRVAALQGSYRIISQNGYILSIGSKYTEALREEDIEEHQGGCCFLANSGGERNYLITNADKSKVLNVLHAFGTNFFRFFWWLGARPVDGIITVERNDETMQNRGVMLLKVVPEKMYFLLSLDTSA